jgi:hypothetical protein
VSGVKIRCAFPKNADLQVGTDFWHPTGLSCNADRPFVPLQVA